MEPVRHYFSALATDIGICIRFEDPTPSDHLNRILSVALRVIGMLAVPAAISAVVLSALITLNVSFVGVIGVVAGIWLTIFALDVIKIGRNISSHLAELRACAQEIAELLERANAMVAPTVDELIYMNSRSSNLHEQMAALRREERRCYQLRGTVLDQILT